MVYRLSFSNGGASLKTRIAKPPCYYADWLSRTCDDKHGLLKQAS
jgi:hypothetical protein